MIPVKEFVRQAEERLTRLSLRIRLPRAGQYTNLATLTVSAGNITLTRTDAANYYGTVIDDGRISIEKAVNAADRHHLSFAESLIPLAVERQLGIIGMKIPARSRILASYRPTGPNQQPGALTMREALYYTLSLPVSTVIIGCDTIAQLEENVALASAFTPLTETQLAALAEKTAPIAQQALWFRRWA